MASESIRLIDVSSVAAADAQPAFAGCMHAVMVDYWTLTKPEVNFLIALATLTGFYLGCPTHPQGFPFWLLIHTSVGYAAGRQRHQYAESIHRATFRCPDATDGSATARSGQTEALRGSWVRGGALRGWQHLSCDGRQSACESARNYHATLLPVSLHSA